MSITVITPTTGTPYLEKCIASIQKQTVPCEHWIVCDGPEFSAQTNDIIYKFPATNIHTLTLPHNVGKDGWCGHRVYAACSWLCNTDFIVFLDEDNFVSRKHLESLLAECKLYGLDWAYALRKIVDKDGAVVCPDLCESLGYLGAPYDRPNEPFIDTSCFFIRTEVAKRISLSWNLRACADRPVSQALLTQYPKHRCTRKFTMRYRIHESHKSVSGVSRDYFLEGNRQNLYRISASLIKPVLYVYHFDPENTAAVLSTMQEDRRTYAEYQLSNYDDLRRHYHLVNGYTHGHTMRPGDTCLVQFVHLAHLPWSVLKRADIVKILYVVESPNVRHTMQWDDFLMLHFTHVLCFWKPLAARLDHVRYAPMNTHFIDFDDAICVAEAFIDNVDATDKKVCMVLEARTLCGEYIVRDVLLHAQDHLRIKYMRDLDNATVYGRGWDRVALGPGVTVGHVIGKEHDTRRSIDLLSQHTFAVIVENCDAEGYVSEKFYDCLAAGTIPVYYGNIHESVGIPSHIYIDAKRFDTSKELQACLDATDVKRMKRDIAECRLAILQKVGCQAFTSWISDVYGKPGRLSSWGGL